MNTVGNDLNSTGTVLTRSQLEEHRRKRGQCVNCGRKCFKKGLFKQIPITEEGFVFEGQCLKCPPSVSRDTSLIPWFRGMNRIPSDERDQFSIAQSKLKYTGDSLTRRSSSEPSGETLTVHTISYKASDGGSFFPREQFRRVGRAETVSAGDSHFTDRSQSHRGMHLFVGTGDNSSINRSPVPTIIYCSAPRKQGLNINAVANTSDDVSKPQIASLPSTYGTQDVHNATLSKGVSHPTPPGINTEPYEDDASVVSAITAYWFGEESVDDVHMAVTTLRAEIQESRAEAAKAIMVAKEALQIAETNSLMDWKDTVTDDAPKADASAQEQLAEVKAKAEMMEECLKLEQERSSIWKKQAETVAAEAGHLQTRAAVADVQRGAMADALEGERKARKISEMSFQSEIHQLRTKLAMERSMRRKVMNEIQVLRGKIRVYCRLRHPLGTSIISVPSQEILLLHQERTSFQVEALMPQSFEFDGILAADSTQDEVYEEMEAVCLSALDGYNACLMMFGQSNSGKTYTILGNVRYQHDDVYIEDYGIQLQAAKQIFSIMEQRRNLYVDTVNVSILEISNGRLIDLIVGTESWRLGGASHDETTASQSENRQTWTLKPIARARQRFMD